MTLKLLRPDQVADRLNASKRTVYRLIDAGCFVALKVGACLRVTEQSVEKYIRKQMEIYAIDHDLLDLD